MVVVVVDCVVVVVEVVEDGVGFQDTILFTFISCKSSFPDFKSLDWGK